MNLVHPKFASYIVGLFLQGPEKFLHSESRIKISNLMITERFYSGIVTKNGGVFEKLALVSLMGL